MGNQSARRPRLEFRIERAGETRLDSQSRSLENLYWSETGRDHKPVEAIEREGVAYRSGREDERSISEQAARGFD